MSRDTHLCNKIIKMQNSNYYKVRIIRIYGNEGPVIQMGHTHWEGQYVVYVEPGGLPFMLPPTHFLCASV